ncbi:MAG: galactose oxidase-like domain-containing protein, partial [Gammaproteobacteria bacterium]
AESGKRIRWYVFNLDLGEQWHNFHPHGQRFKVGDEIMDTRSLGPAESFCVDTIVPPVILLPDCDHHSHYGEGSHGHTHGNSGHSGSGSQSNNSGQDPSNPSQDWPDPDCEKVKLCGDFLVHCHVEMHMMQGMAALVRAVQEVEVTAETEKQLGFHLPECTEKNECPKIDHHICGGDDTGQWESLPDSPVFVVHAGVLPTGKVLLYSGGAEAGYPNESRVFDPEFNTFTAQAYDQDLFCSGHAWMADGRLLVAGGAPFGAVKSAHIFTSSPTSGTWTAAGVAADMARERWYPTLLTLSDGRILAVSGLHGAAPIEIYDPGTNKWTAVAGGDHEFPELYPSLHLLPSGEVFYSRAGWASAAGTQTAYLRFTGPNAGSWINLGQQQFFDRQEGTAVLQIDTTVSPPSAIITIFGGGVTGVPTSRNPQSCERIDVTRLSPVPAWQRVPPADMNYPRGNVSGVLLPDGTILAVGGQRNGKWSTDPQPVLPCEIYHPATNTWSVTAPMAHPRQYHSIAVLLPDGRILTAGGVDPTLGGAPARDQRYLEIFTPSYLMRGPRPTITGAPASVAYGAAIDIDTPDAANIDSVVLMRPCAMTHHTDAGQRYIKLPITGRDPGRIHVTAPLDGNIAPPGPYMLFILNAAGVPSVGRFIGMP